MSHAFDFPGKTVPSPSHKNQSTCFHRQPTKEEEEEVGEGLIF